MSDAPQMAFRLEVVVMPVTDVDRAREFYETCGWHLDVDHDAGPFRVVQLTPPGSACSITFGVDLGHDMPPGSIKGLHLVVTDITAARAELVERGIEISPIRHMTPDGWQDGVDPAHGRYNSFANFADPDGNSWVLQEVPDES